MPRAAYVVAQFLRLLPRYEFQRIGDKYHGDFRTKHFKCWHQLVCMMFAHIRQQNSLRDIDIALNAQAHKLYHIGIQQCPKRASFIPQFTLFTSVGNQLLEYEYASKIVALIATMHLIRQDLDKRYIFMYKRNREISFNSLYWGLYPWYYGIRQINNLYLKANLKKDYLLGVPILPTKYA
jgi:hypothetical protein